MARAESAETAEKNRVGHRLARRRPLAGVQGHTGIENRKRIRQPSGAWVRNSRVPFTARSAVGPGRQEGLAIPVLLCDLCDLGARLVWKSLL